MYISSQTSANTYKSKPSFPPTNTRAYTYIHTYIRVFHYHDIISLFMRY